jgi:hypothetical protein
MVFVFEAKQSETSPYVPQVRFLFTYKLPKTGCVRKIAFITADKSNEKGVLLLFIT